MGKQGHKIPIALTIAGSDSSGGAGIQADLKTFTAFGVYGASVITALTAQNTLGVQGIEPVRPSFVAAQIKSVLSDLAVGGIKTGMLATPEIIGAVVDALKAAAPCPLVVDPVMVATSGDLLLLPEAIDVLKRRLLPMATLVTPNLPEAAALLGTGEAKSQSEVARQAKSLHGLGCGAVLIKGGHGTGEAVVDVLYDGAETVGFERPRIDTPNTHGTGCTLSAAIAALLACGIPLKEAVGRAKVFVWKALDAGRELKIGHGSGPADHLFSIRCAGMPV